MNPDHLSSASYDAANELTQWGATLLTYDSDGNLANDGASTYSWDARNQLSSMGGSANGSFGYDAFGRRIGRNSTSFLYDGVNSVQELAGGSPIANVLTGGIDENFLRSDISGTWTFLSDALGSTTALADSTGAVQTQYTYEPFGNTSLTGAADSNTAQYTGRENDGTGLYYYRARYYNSKIDRFIAEDPIGFGGGSSNLYAYAYSNPIGFRDPSGNFVDPVTMGAALCAGGALVGGYEYYWYHILTGRKTSFAGYAWSASGGCLAGIGLAFGLTEGAAVGITGLSASAILASNYGAGMAFQDEAIDALGAAKNWSKVSTSLGSSIPDVIDDSGNYIEIKSGEYLSYTQQMQIQIGAALENGVSANLIVSPQAVVSAPLQAAIAATGGQISVYNASTGGFSPYVP